MLDTLQRRKEAFIASEKYLKAEAVKEKMKKATDIYNGIAVVPLPGGREVALNGKKWLIVPNAAEIRKFGFMVPESMSVSNSAGALAAVEPTSVQSEWGDPSSTEVVTPANCDGSGGIRYLMNSISFSFAFSERRHGSRTDSIGQSSCRKPFRACKEDHTVQGGTPFL